MKRNCLATLVVVLALPSLAFPESSAADLAKATQNPVADLISVPFQNNFDMGWGPNDDVRWTMNVQPVIPISLSEDWNLITRWILPVIYQPRTAVAGDEFGVGDFNPTLWLSPAKGGDVTWGFGPTLVLPTASDEVLGSEKWSAGPSMVALITPDPWVAGILLSNVWSFAGESDRESVNQLFFQYFINYNLDDGWYLTSAPIHTANWKAKSSERWTVPVGGGIGKLIRISDLPINTSLQAFWNVISPDDRPSADWQLRFQLQFLFPKG